MNSWAIHLIASGCLLTSLHAAEVRTFRSSDGNSVQARFEGFEDGMVTLRRADGKAFTMPLDILSPDDQTLIKSTADRLQVTMKKLNEAAGHELATFVPFDGRDAEDLSQDLRLRPESTSKYGRSWRLYASRVEGYRLFNAMPYSVALYSDEDGTASNLSIVYANKGDFGSKAGAGEDHFEGGVDSSAGTLNAAMKRDEAAITIAIEKALGPGKVQRYGEGKARRQITRWDWHGHSFLLSSEEDEYVSLSIVPTSMADGGGKSARMNDSLVKDRIRQSVVRNENGDVYLTQIPMVDQGPKGYCVPATFERTMRTMGIEADMYLLAMVGESKAGGGTSVEKLLENVRSQVYRKGRRTKEEDIKELRIRDVKRYLDEGIPVMWVMCSVKEYNEIANENTRSRANSEDLDGLKGLASEMQEKSESIIKAPKPSENHHICMIIGYNETTQELAVSDSWGASYEIRWVPLAVADWVSNRRLFMILP